MTLPLIDQRLLDRLRGLPDPAVTMQWPAERLKAIGDAGFFRWGLPEDFGGKTVSGLQAIDAYVELARACLTSTFILTQRDAACHRIANSPNGELRQRLLPGLIQGSSLATVGISHLSTSRQHWSRPSVIARTTSGGFELTGEAPWVTGAAHADLLVTGASLENGEQILVAIPTRQTGVVIGAPLNLLALNASMTGTVTLDHVAVSTADIIFGPAPQVMKIGATGGTGSLTTSAVALGAALRTFDGLQEESRHRPELHSSVMHLVAESEQLQSELRIAVQTSPEAGTPPGLSAEAIRFKANSLSSRTALAYVSCAKGAGFVSGHPAERALREAMFFQVWSCPPSVTRDTIHDLSVRATARNL
jgi:alkylation response protein AidB-like acyl-CoA dehydrogenase